MTEYINKSDAIKAVFDCERYTGIDEAPYEYADDLLNKLPTIDIVTCGECMYWCGEDEEGGDCHDSADWFCADAIRKE